MIDLFSWKETPAAPVQGPPEPESVQLAVHGSLTLKRYRTGWGTHGLVIESMEGKQVSLGHAATWHNFGYDGDDMDLTQAQLDTVQKWCTEYAKAKWFWTEQDQEDLETAMQKEGALCL